MGGLIKIVFPLVGYLCVATVITMVGGYGYLRSNGTLDDENLFQIVSLVHGVNLQEIAEANLTDSQDVPSEEMSFDARRQFALMNALHLQTKKDDIEKNIRIFRAELNKLDSKFGQMETIRSELKTLFESHMNDRDAEGLADVVNQLKGMNPRKQGKPLIVKYILNNQMDIAIKLLNNLTPAIRNEIIATFDKGEDDIKMLYEIQQKMLEGDLETANLDEKLEALNQ